MKCLIVDNDTLIREGLRKMLEQFCPNVQKIIEAESIEKGIEVLKLYEPDLIFLDVELDDGFGFDLLQKIGNYQFQVIFITAHNKYAVNAFRYSAIDFLLKPIDPDELVEAVHKAENSLEKSNYLKQLEILHKEFKNINSEERRLVLKDAESIHFIKISDIIRCEADGAYTRFIIENAHSILVSKSMKEYEDILLKNNFIRCHNSHIVNGNKIVRMDKQDGGQLILSNQEIIPVSFRKKDHVVEWLTKKEH